MMQTSNKDKIYEVNRDQYLSLTKTFAGLIFHRKENEKYFVKTGFSNIQKVIEKIIK